VGYIVAGGERFLHLNTAYLWPAFNTGSDVVIDAGALQLRLAGKEFVRAGAFVGGPIGIRTDKAP